VTYKIHGALPQGQTAMNSLAWDLAKSSWIELNSKDNGAVLVSEVLDDYEESFLWRRFVAAQADAVSGLSHGQPACGTIGPTLYHGEVERLNRWRLEDLKKHPRRFLNNEN